MSTDPRNSGRDLAGVIAQLRRRQRLVNLCRWLGHGLFFGIIAACALAALAWAIASPSAWRLALLAAASAALLTLIAAAVGALLPISDLYLARALDRAAGSEDRLASALQLAGHHRRARADLVVEDALGRVSSTSAGAALPVRVPRSARWLPLPVA